jgi:hypothetical protein
MDLKGRIIFCFILLAYITSLADEHPVIGGNAAAMGCTSVTRTDLWSAFNNQAGLGWCNTFSAGLYFENRYLLKELSLKAIGLTLPVGKGAFGITFREFGFSLYNEMNTGISYGMRLTRHFSVGVQINNIRLHVADGYKDNSVCSCELGLQFKASDHLWLGLHITNPVPEKFSSVTNDRLTTLMSFGLSWRISEQVHPDLEIEKDLTHKPALKAGIEYLPSKLLFVRIGFLTNPASFTFGFGIKVGNIQFDIASSYHMVLGYSPQASMTYILKEKKRGKK